MRCKPASFILAAAFIATTASSPTPAAAACKKFGFEVNDYGKDGPTRDAQALLDKHIATWAKEKGIKTYTTGKKDVSCELFLNFIVFDEHTCKATATVCWQGADPSPAPAATKPAAKPAAKPKPKAAAAQ
jgi:hypothetical protein